MTIGRKPVNLHPAGYGGRCLHGGASGVPRRFMPWPHAAGGAPIASCAGCPRELRGTARGEAQAPRREAGAKTRRAPRGLHVGERGEHRQPFRRRARSRRRRQLEVIDPEVHARPAAQRRQGPPRPHGGRRHFARVRAILDLRAREAPRHIGGAFQRAPDSEEPDEECAHTRHRADPHRRQQRQPQGQGHALRREAAEEAAGAALSETRPGGLHLAGGLQRLLREHRARAGQAPKASMQPSTSCKCSLSVWMA